MSDPCEISALDVLATGTFWAWALPLSPVFATPAQERTTSASSCGGRADPRGCSERGGDFSSALPGNASIASSHVILGKGTSLQPPRARLLLSLRKLYLSFRRFR